MALTENTILDQLEEDLKTKIDPTGDFSTKPTVFKGVFNQTDVEGKMPAICFSCYGEELDVMMANEIHTYLNIRMYGFTGTDGYNDNANIRMLCHDVLYFLYSDEWTYTDQTDVNPNIEYYEGGPSRPVSMFMFDIKVRNDATYNTLRN